MARMNPKRWLLVIAFSATMYVAVVATAALGGIWSVPQQLHSLILVSLAVAAIIAARAASAACSDRLASAERADHAAALGRQLAALRREMPTQQLRVTVRDPDELDRYAEGFVDALAKQRVGIDATVIKMGDRKS